MKGEWIEVKVVTTSDALEPVSGIFYSLGIKGVSIEDPNDMLMREAGPLTWDFADINVFEYGDRAAVVKGYFTPEDDIDGAKKNIEEKLPSKEFIRVHRSYFVRIDKIKKISEDIILVENKLIPVSKSYKKDLLDRLNLL